MRLLLSLLAVSVLSAQQYDLVIANGRLMDPASGLDAIRNLGIRNGMIAAISSGPLSGKSSIDAKGLVVAPGFIDLHSHGQTPESYRFKARDGVTTALEMEVGVSPVRAWYAEREGRSLINFGATVGHIPARMAVLHDTGSLLPRDKGTGPTNTAQRQQVIELLERGLQEGALGIGWVSPTLRRLPAPRSSKYFSLPPAVSRLFTCICAVVVPLSLVPLIHCRKF